MDRMDEIKKDTGADSSRSSELEEKLFSPKVRVVLIRHGETKGWLEKRLDGHTDSPLTENGKEQLKEVAQRLSGLPITAVYSSDLSRTMQGAQMLAEKIGLEVNVLPGLRELNFGEMENIPFEETFKKFDGDMERALNWVDNSFPGGESLLDMKERVMPAYRKIIEDNSGMVAIYAHGGTNRLILCEELGIDLYNFFRIEQNHACINLIDRFEGGYVVVKLINGCVNSIRL
jgi:alpha-ribazole phosphatase